jgi:branched-chain amino acid transport system permease protein
VKGADFLMDNILSLFVLGVSFGLTYFLLATGLTLTMGLMRVVNMSHGALYMIAGYLGVTVYTATGSWVLSIISATILAGLLGLIMEVGFLKRLYAQPQNQVLLTIGFINIINNVAQWIWGGYPKIAPVPPSLSGSVVVGSVEIPVFRFFIIGFGVVMAILLWYLQDKTRIGAMVRAGMDNGEVAGTLGMNNKLLFTGVFVLGSAVAGLTSMIGGTLTGLNMATGWDVLLNSIIVVVVGGTGSIQGALIAGLIIGLVNTFGAAYFPMIASLLIYLVLVIILIIKPSGILGRQASIDRTVEINPAAAVGIKRSRPFWVIKRDEFAKTKASRKIRAFSWAPYSLVLLFLIVVPSFMSTYMQSMMTRVLIFALFAISLDIVMGFLGMRSFGHAAYLGMGGYVIGLLAVHYDIELSWIAIPLTLVITALLAMFIGYFSLRVTGTHFLLVTMAFGQMLYVVATKWYKFTGGSDGLIGIPRPQLGFPISWNSAKIYYFTLIVFLICYYLIYRFTKSAFGSTLLGIRENEGRMRSLGFNTWSIKYLAVIIAGIFGGIAGILYAYTYQAMVPSNFALETSALPMLMVIMGGGATLWGPALAAAVITLVQNFAGIFMPDRWPLILGILYVVCVMFLRGGFARYLTVFWYWIGNKVFSKDKDLNGVINNASAEEVES